MQPARQLASRAVLVQFRATGGGAYKFAELFREELGVTLKKEDEMGCLVTGCNFLLHALRHEAFEFQDNVCTFMSHHAGAQEGCICSACTHSHGDSQCWMLLQGACPAQLRFECMQVTV